MLLFFRFFSQDIRSLSFPLPVLYCPWGRGVPYHHHHCLITIFLEYFDNLKYTSKSTCMYGYTYSPFKLIMCIKTNFYVVMNTDNWTTTNEIQKLYIWFNVITKHPFLWGIMVRVFANGPKEWSSIPGLVIRQSKNKDIILDASLLNTQ